MSLAKQLGHRRAIHSSASRPQPHRCLLQLPRHSRQRSRCSAAVLPELQTLLQQAGTAHPGWAAGAGVNTAVFIAGSPVLLKGLTNWGMVNAFILGTTVFAAFGAGGFALVCIYFLFGTAVSVRLGCCISHTMQYYSALLQLQRRVACMMESGCPQHAAPHTPLVLASIHARHSTNQELTEQRVCCR